MRKTGKVYTCHIVYTVAEQEIEMKPKYIFRYVQWQSLQ